MPCLRLVRVHQSWTESQEDLVSHILRCVLAASDSQPGHSAQWCGKEGRGPSESEGRQTQAHAAESAGREEICRRVGGGRDVQ